MKSFAAALLFIPFVSAATFTVGVGKDETTGKKGIGFDPSEIYPVAGDTIVFEFRSGSHSVVQSSFDEPCTPLSGGYDSGVQTVADNVEVDASGLPTTTLSVTDTQPMWFFDQAAGTCNKGGVLAVNAPRSGTQTAASFKEKASTAAMATATAPSTSSETSSATTSGSPAATSSAAPNSGIGLELSGVSIAVAFLGGVVAKIF